MVDMRRSHLFRGITALLLIAAILLAMAGCNGYGSIPELIEPQNAQRPTCAAEYRTVFDVEVLDGEIVPETTELRADRSEKVLSCKVFPGQQVKAGDVLLEYDLLDAQEELEDLTAEYEYVLLRQQTEESEDAGNLEIARIELEKLRWQGAGYMQILQKEQEIEKLELENEQHAQERVFELEKMEAKLKDLQESVADNVLTSPSDGIVVYTANLQNGTQIMQKDLLFIIASEKKFRIQSEFKSSRILNDCSKLEAWIGGTAYPIEAIPYDQNEYNRRIIAGSDVYSYYSIKGAKADGVQMGDYAAVFLYTNYKEYVLTLPATAVYRDDGGFYVYLADGEHNIRQPITVGTITTLYYEITGGIEEGERVYVKE